jgi:hypothetical protein
MSPLTLRRFRADRLLRTEFERMRGRVIGGVSQRLRAVGVQLDAGDLDACYAQASLPVPLSGTLRPLTGGGTTSSTGESAERDGSSRAS